MAAQRAGPVVTLPTLHADQVRAFWAYKRFPRFVLRAGRRWGKTALLTTIACDCAVKGGYVGWFVPEYKYSAEAFHDIADIVAPVCTASSKVDGVIRLATGGRFDFWTLLNNDRAGASRSYDLVVFDEEAFNKPSVKATWERSVEPTLLDRSGRAIFASNTNGVDPENHFYQLSEMVKEGKPGYGEHHAPTAANPLIPMRLAGESEEDHARRRLEVLAALKAEKPPLVWLQEHEADFVSWDGVAFFELAKLLELDLPVAYPARCDAVYATVDTATKTGRENDGTAVCYWALTAPGRGPHQLVLLDWDVAQIEGSLLESWLPTVFRQLEAFAVQCGARAGSQGAFIEDKASGMVLLQQAARHGWPATPINSKFTSIGKVERCLSVSGYVYRGLVKISGPAYDKVATYKGATRNHLLGQVLAFRVDDKDPNREDDALDAFVYGVAAGIGNNEGF